MELIRETGLGGHVKVEAILGGLERENGAWTYAGRRGRRIQNLVLSSFATEAAYMTDFIPADAKRLPAQGSACSTRRRQVNPPIETLCSHGQTRTEPYYGRCTKAISAGTKVAS